ncbi:DNA alkylation repair protein [Prosthecobacter sp.]|uniref:DNA alkylation repair protein n=1 Tax=Prosthecobacter sp. TaxID=1965333 RepID=UPI001D9D4A8E|nr:DNA alkylation repair protein [Prosthecobacter sp.]MCB1276311.1 DNA alkylation repair protein [Prosthecobacter sp.]
MQLLASKGSEQTKQTYKRHGAPEPMFGVKIGDLKPIVKQIKGDQALAMQLYDTGNSDAMYLAGLVADGSKMKRAELERWVKGATWHMISGCTVPWVAAEHPDAVEIALKWVDSPKEPIAVSGWATLSSVVSVRPDDELPIKQLDALLTRIVKTIRTTQNRVRYAMNNFVIGCGTYVAPLADKAIAAARKIGHVEVDMGQTDCQVPDAESYIVKSRRGLPVAPKRKNTRC